MRVRDAYPVQSFLIFIRGIMRNKLLLCALFSILATAGVFAQFTTDPLPYAPIANPLPDTMDQLYRDSVNLRISRVRVNQAGYRPQDAKYIYYVAIRGGIHF